VLRLADDEVATQLVFHLLTTLLLALEDLPTQGVSSPVISLHVKSESSVFQRPQETVYPSAFAQVFVAKVNHHLCVEQDLTNRRQREVVLLLLLYALLSPNVDDRPDCKRQQCLHFRSIELDIVRFLAPRKRKSLAVTHTNAGALPQRTSDRGLLITSQRWQRPISAVFV